MSSPPWVCKVEDCNLRATYGYQEKRVKLACHLHRSDYMVNLNKKCMLCCFNLESNKICYKCSKIRNIEEKLLIKYIKMKYKKYFGEISRFDKSNKILIIVNKIIESKEEDKEKEEKIICVNLDIYSPNVASKLQEILFNIKDIQIGNIASDNNIFYI